MSELEYFEIVGDHAEYRPMGVVSVVVGVQMVTAAIVFAREQKVGRLLVVTTGVKGLEPPSLGERYWMANEWAEVARGFVRVAVVARPELIHPQKFGMAVATSRGMIADVFSEEAEALAWLRDVT